MKYNRLFFIMGILLAVILSTGCSDDTKLPYQLIDSGVVMKSKADFLEETKWNLAHDFEQIDNSSSLSSYLQIEPSILSGKEVSMWVSFTDKDMVNFVRYYKTFQDAGTSRDYVYQIYDDIIDRYGKPDTSIYTGDRLTNHREVSVGDLGQDRFEWWDEWLMPPIMDDPCTAVILHYSYNDYAAEGEEYLVMFTIAPYSLRNFYNRSEER